MYMIIKFKLSFYSLSLFLLLFAVSTIFANTAFADTFMLSGTVQNSSGSAVGGSTVTATDTTNGTVIGSVLTDSNLGNYNFPLIPGGIYNIQVTPPSGSNLSAVVAINQTISSNSTINFTLVPANIVVISGTIYDSHGNSISKPPIKLSPSGVGTTDTSGNYSYQVAPGSYIVEFGGIGPLQGNQPSTYSLLLPSRSYDQSTIQNFTIPAKQVTVHVQDQAGTAVPNVNISTNSVKQNNLNLGNEESVSGTNSIPSTAHLRTDEYGNAVMWLFPGSNPYTITASPTGPYVSYTLYNVYVSSDQTEIVALQYNHFMPITTATLETQHPDSTYSNPTTVTLSATAASGYTVATTYYKIDGGVQQTYSVPFEVSGEGAHSIEYWSVDNSGVPESHKTTNFTIHVNEAPVVDPFAGGTINEGQTFTASSSFTDEDSTAWTATVDYGDGAGEEPLTLNQDKTFNLSHQYNTPDEYTVIVVVRDDELATGTTMATVIVNGKPQIATLTGATIDSAETYTENGSFTDTDSTSWTGTVNYGDGSGTQPLSINGTTFALSHQYTNSGNFTVTVEITDNQGATATKTVAVQVNNQAPYVSPISDAALNAGGTYTDTSSFADEDSTSWTATVDYGEGAGEEPLTLNPDKTFTVTHQYNTAGEYDVSVVIKDDSQNTGTTIATVTVNALPQVGTLADATIARGQTYSATGLFTDADSASWSATVNYGDGSGTQPLTLNSDKTFTLSHQYTTANVYTLVVTVTDNEGAIDTETATITVLVPEPVTTTFTSSADTYVKSGSDNRNTGAGTFMRLRSGGDNRSLVRFDQTAIQTEIGNKEVLSAKLKVTIVDNGNNWGAGRTIDVHRLIASWAEGNGTENNRGTGLGATWECATDSNITNHSKNCTGTTEWEMGQPNNPSLHSWAQTATATQTITNNLSGVVEFDVTEDVASFLNNTNANNGWIIKKTNEGQNGQVSFGTKESASVPQLIVTYQP
jgi:hypothetical protein